jgi:hypothetical protein
MPGLLSMVRLFRGNDLYAVVGETPEHGRLTYVPSPGTAPHARSALKGDT